MSVLRDVANAARAAAGLDPDELVDSTERTRRLTEAYDREIAATSRPRKPEDEPKKRKPYTPPIPARAIPHFRKIQAKLQSLGQRDACPAPIRPTMWALGDLTGSSEVGAKLAIPILPPPLSEPLCELFSRRVCPLRVEYVTADDPRYSAHNRGVVPAYRAATKKRAAGAVPLVRRRAGDGWVHDELLFDLRHDSSRKYVGGLLMLWLGSRPSSRRGYSRLCSQYTAATRAMCVTKGGARRSPSGVCEVRYGKETWRKSGEDRLGIPVGVNDWIRWFSETQLCGEIDVKQPPAGIVGPDERGPKKAHYQWWFGKRLTLGAWLPTVNRWAQPASVRAFCGISRMATGEREGLRLVGIVEASNDPLTDALADLEADPAFQGVQNSGIFRGVLERSLAPPPE